MNRGTVIGVSLVLALTLCVGAAADQTLGTPVNLGPQISSAGNEGSPKISADGLELYFNSNRPGGSGSNDLWVARRPTAESPWGHPVNLGPVVNTAAAELTPTIATDGLELYFCDYAAPRPGGLGKTDIWVTKRVSKYAEWGPPVNLGPIVNTPYDDVTPEISADGLELYFNSNRPGGAGGDDLWVARRASGSDQWGPPVCLGPTVNSMPYNHCATITSDGLTLFYDSGATEAAGDLMMARRPTLRSDWGRPVNLGHVASDHFASCVSWDGETLYFSSTRPGGYGGNDIWMMPISIK